MYEMKNQSIARERFLSELIDSKKRALEHVPEGTLRASPHGKSYQFFQRTEKTGTNGRYLKNSEKELVHALAQKEYDKKVLSASEKEIAVLSRLNRLYDLNETVEDLFEKQPAGKRKYIKPVELPLETFVSNWKAEQYSPLEFSDSVSGFYSDNDEQMRSKSEVIIANMLKKHGVPYRYECPLLLDEKPVYPDFTVLNVRLRKEMYWEHMGLLDDPDYLEKNLLKIQRYEMNGFFLGDKLILTFETLKQPLNMKLLEKTIEQYCK